MNNVIAGRHAAKEWKQCDRYLVLEEETDEHRWKNGKNEGHVAVDHDPHDHRTDGKGDCKKAGLHWDKREGPVNGFRYENTGFYKQDLQDGWNAEKQNVDVDVPGFLQPVSG